MYWYSLAEKTWNNLYVTTLTQRTCYKFNLIFYFIIFLNHYVALYMCRILYVIYYMIWYYNIEYYIPLMTRCAYNYAVMKPINSLASSIDSNIFLGPKNIFSWVKTHFFSLCVMQKKLRWNIPKYLIGMKRRIKLIHFLNIRKNQWLVLRFRKSCFHFLFTFYIVGSLCMHLAPRGDLF